MRFFFLVFIVPLTGPVKSQQIDSVNRLTSVEVKAYEQTRKIKDVPAAIGFLNQLAFEKFSSASIVFAVNTLPGVKLEERSPGSYRFNIRGSSLRSPFGVRNVKIYYNDVPFTDPGGHSYFNNLGYYNFNSIEVIKGPGSSVYGAGTGGVLLIEGMNANEKAGIFSEYTHGGYGLRNIYASATAGTSKIGFQHQQSAGYRNHSELNRNILSWNGRFKTSEMSFLKTTFLYSDLFYETPGALTKVEFENDPKLARPAGGGFPGAEQAQASIQQKTFLAGLSHMYRFSQAFSNNTVAYGMFTELWNPAIRNYGKNQEPHVGGRTSFSYNKSAGNGSIINLIAGAETQQGFASVFVFKNKNGEPDTLQTLDEIRTSQSLIFMQASYEITGWELTAGTSINFLSINFKRSTPLPLAQQQRTFDNEISPRFALAKKWKALSVYSSVARGFSPPASAELLPSGSNINLSLDAEKGTNYDIGFRGNIKKIYFDVNAFFFSLQNTIVQRRDAGGGDFFTNAGSTSQKGIETSLNYSLHASSSLNQTRFWLNHTYHFFRYKEFKQLVTDYSGKRLPGTAPHVVSTGIDLSTKNGFFANINYYYSDKIPLNDANSEYADAYHLLNARIGFEKIFSDKWKTRLAAGSENLLNQRYSLGNDINGFGGRFYNAAPARSFYVTMTIQFFTGKR